MEAEKIKQIVKEFISSEEDGFVRNEHGVIWFESENGQQGINLEVYFEDIVEFALEKASQFKQQPVVMPSEEEYAKQYKDRQGEVIFEARDFWDKIYEPLNIHQKGFLPPAYMLDFADKYADYIRGNKGLSLSKEADKERMPNVGETIKETAIDRSTIRDIIRKNSGYEYVTGHGILANDVHIHGLTEDFFDLFKQRK